ncbi:hypothetical protein [Streptomyces sodiiphilus]|uniref:hypothetical protein n=1 Tax=Streptomyces sodiiphilus TaxID=226217 RepID=UPI003CD07ED6
MLAGPVRERYALFGNPADGDHSDGQAQSPGWHAGTLRKAGFAEARPVWASLSDAVVLALR